MTKLGILFFADRLPPLIGGMEMHAKYFIEYFINHSKFPILSIITKNLKGQDCIILDGKLKLINLNKLEIKFVMLRVIEYEKNKIIFPFNVRIIQKNFGIISKLKQDHQMVLVT